MTASPPVVFPFILAGMTEKQVRDYFEARHRALVIEDDWICAQFGLSRKARGKKAERYLSADKQVDKTG